MKTKKSFWFKIISVYAGLNLLGQIFYPTVAMALTGGPSQPEMAGFEPVGTTNMVDLSSGSFTYNIPLMDVEGYPINLAYHSGVTMDQEASWVGLGWSINPGEINRQMRGIPDDFSGDQVTERYNLKDNITVGLNAGIGLKIVGFPIGLNATAGIFYNNYKGPGVSFGITPTLSCGQPNKGCLTAGLGLNFNSQSGVDISPSVGFEKQVASNGQYNVDAGVKVGSSYNSRTGVKGISMSKDLTVDKVKPDMAHDESTGKDVDVTKGDLGQTSGTLQTSFASFSAPSYIPSIKMPMQNYAVTLDVTLGFAAFGIHPNFTFSGWFNEQTLATHQQSLPAYGYMFADQAQNNAYAIHDFNREKDIPFLPNIANLPITNFTYDLYSINGEGVSGQFRPFRGDVGILYDHENYNQSVSGSLGIELGFLPEVSHNGIQLNVTTSNTTTDQWLGDNQFASTVKFQSLLPGNMNYEPYYLKRVGEKTINDAQYYSTIDDVNPISVHLLSAGSDVIAQPIFNKAGPPLGISSNLMKTRREKRVQSTSILNAAEASKFGLQKKILSYPINTSVYSSLCAYAGGVDSIDRLSWNAWHSSQITVTNPDGKRYVYGIPAYNTVHNEVSFAVGGTPGMVYNNDDFPLYTYASGDNSIGNTEGLDNYYDEQSLPPYAHSYLLTGILSPDYVDMTGNGITDDDLGQAVKINYSRLYNKQTPYRWRVPFEKNQANYQKGLLTNQQDDKANYLYGEKEVWYVHSVESKTMVAQFVLQDRYDAFGVTDSNGGMDTTRHLKYLQEINLYSKADLIAHGPNAVPVKTVHFEYSYELCPGVPNSDCASGAGKLTLKRVYFTYANNAEGSLNSYVFNYKGSNPGYNHSNADRWGNYKPSLPGLSNEDYPYSSQDPVAANSASTAWELTDIDLPSGGHITVNYESNDYAYVQDERASQMFMVSGMSSGPDPTGTNQVFTGGISGWNDWIDITIPVAETTRAGFAADYLEGIQNNQLYFRYAVDVDGHGHYEYVSGYAPIADYQPASTTDHTKWSIELARVGSGDAFVGSADPISLATWQFLRLNLPQYAYPGSSTSSNILGMIEALGGILFDVIDMFTGFDGRMALQGAGQNFSPKNSWIRLTNPTFKKYGGGARVREIDISDNWANMAAGQSSYTYGQTYDYTTPLVGYGPNRVMSTGVATYEPLTGGDENTLKQPLPYDQKYILAPNNQFYTETPLGENLYPSPGVVYSKVTVTNLKHPGTERTSTGYTVNEFYTAKDFPVINKWTDLDVERYHPSILSSLLSFGSKDFSTVSQGFSVEVNDMAGKSKGQEVYDQNGSLISSTHTYYHTDNPSSPTLHLNNDVLVMNQNSSLGVASIGKDIDTWEDMREQDSQTEGYGGTFNNEFFIFPFFAIPIDIPIIIPSYSSEHTRFRSSVTTKYIYRTGIVDSVANMKYGSYVTNKNLFYDAETGGVVFSSSKNEFNGPQLTATYPAHWAYPGMGSEYQNIGAVVPVSNITNGGFVSPADYIAKQYFTPGDELEFIPSSGPILDTLLWVTQPTTGGAYSVMDRNGYPVTITSSGNLKVIRSGYRNMPDIPVEKTTESFSGTLQTSASLFNDLWQVPVTNFPVIHCDSGGGPTLTCLLQFLDSLAAHDQFFATPTDNIIFGKYAPGCGDSTALYYALSSEIGSGGQVKHFSAQLGNCQLIFSAPTGYSYDDSIYTLTSRSTFYLSEENPCGIAFTSNMFKDGSVCLNCQQCTQICADLSVGEAFNPYAIGMLGNWRPERNYVYYTDRAPVLTASTSDIWVNGYLNTWNDIWTPPSSSNYWTLDTVDKNWTWTSRITMYDEKGNEVEDQDALGRYSGALYGYLKSLPIAVSSNSRYEEMAFDGFEDYGFTPSCGNPCFNDHFSYRNLLTNNADTTSSTAHTGRYSLAISSSDSITAYRAINYYSTPLYSTDINHFYLLNGGGIPLFSPDSGDYLLSAWVKEDNCGQTGYKKDSIKVYYSGSPLSYFFHSSGPVIEGWQRFEGRFKVPGSATGIYVTLVAGNNKAYYDDIRIQPFAAEMKSYVYDQTSMRLMATLDENNYATMYEYNDEGILMRVKKETEKGIATIKESRSSYFRK